MFFWHCQELVAKTSLKALITERSMIQMSLDRFGCCKNCVKGGHFNT
ncbi:hypothetical protein M3J09_001098 [Ascochyta lentis]